MGELSNTTINGVSYDFKDAGAARQSHSHTKSQITDFPTSMPASDVSAWAKASTKPSYTASEVGAIATTAKGAASGVAELDSNGKVPSSQLPSYVDDVLEYSAKSSFPATGETGKIYVDTSTNKTYRWSGSAYVEISPSLALGETSSTAYYGDKGKTAYTHSQLTSGNPHNVTKTDVGLGNVGNFKAVSTVASQGLSSTEQANARSNIGAGTGTYSKPSDGIPKTDLESAVQTSLGKADSALQSHQTIKQDGVTGATVNRFGTCSTAAATAAKTVSITTGTFSLEAGARVAVKFSNANTANTPTLNVNSKGAKNIFHKGAQITTGGNKALLAGTVDFIYDGTQWHLIGNYIDTNTTYSAATTSAAGLMSATDKSKLDGIASGAQVNSITGVKGNSESSYRTGNVNLTAANIGAAASSHTHGNIQNGGTLQTNDITIASGDKIIVTDSSDSSKIARTSISFDGSTATKALTKKGTWETFNNYSHPTSAGNKHIPSGGSSGQVLVYGGNSGTASWGNISSEVITLSSFLDVSGSDYTIANGSMFRQGKHVFGTLNLRANNGYGYYLGNIKSAYTPASGVSEFYGLALVEVSRSYSSTYFYWFSGDGLNIFRAPSGGDENNDVFLHFDYLMA